MAADSEAYIVIELFSEKQSDGRLNPVYPCAGIKIAEIVSNSGRYSDFAFHHYTFVLGHAFHRYQYGKHQHKSLSETLHKRKIMIKH